MGKREQGEMREMTETHQSNSVSASSPIRRIHTCQRASSVRRTTGAVKPFGVKCSTVLAILFHVVIRGPNVINLQFVGPVELLPT